MKDDKDITKQKQREENGDWQKSVGSKFWSDRCIRLLAWILLTLGLCIIISTFYLAMTHKCVVDLENHEEFIGTEYEGDATGFKAINPEDPSMYESGRDLDIAGESLNGNIISRRVNEWVSFDSKNILQNISGCHLKDCQIICAQSTNLSIDLYETMTQENVCDSVRALLIIEQHFDNEVLRNDWKSVGQDVKKLIISDCKISTIKNETFNTPMFATTFFLALSKLTLKNVGAGALLGLNSLKYLTIETEIACLDRDFFQPVQTTLIYLKLNARLTPAEGQNIFGTSHMEKLEYVDLSNNNFNGPLRPTTFLATPELKYLIMTNSKITAIGRGAFEHLIGKLRYVNLSNNHLTNIGADILKPLLENKYVRTHFSMSVNKWICDCSILPLKRLYEENHDRFVDPLFCEAPYKLYGTNIDTLLIDESNCTSISLIIPSSTRPTTIATDKEENVSQTIPISDPKDATNDEQRSEELKDMDSSAPDGYLTDESKTFQVRCLNLLDSTEVSSSSFQHHSTVTTDAEDDFLGTSSESEKQPIESLLAALPANSNANRAFLVHGLSSFQFEGPDYEFHLELLENLTVRVTFEDFPNHDRIFLIYFSEQDEQSSPPCSFAADPLLLGPLQENTTYTFCLVNDARKISPFNCLPLHVPLQAQDNVWIPSDEKQFTIGMLCLIFVLSTFFGAVVAYFGIRAHPDLLEGSKNVLVVKKSDQTCYVATISESEYMKKNSIENTSSVSASAQKASLSERPSAGLPPFAMNVKDLERLASIKSSASTCFEDSFTPMACIVDDDYEMPKQQFGNYGERCVPNTYIATRPRSPPPLPKRNSYNSNELDKTK